MPYLLQNILFLDGNFDDELLTITQVVFILT